MTEPAEPPPTMMVSYTLAFPRFVFLVPQASAASMPGHCSKAPSRSVFQWSKNPRPFSGPQTNAEATGRVKCDHACLAGGNGGHEKSRRHCCHRPKVCTPENGTKQANL